MYVHRLSVIYLKYDEQKKKIIRSQTLTQHKNYDYRLKGRLFE